MQGRHTLERPSREKALQYPGLAAALKKVRAWDEHAGSSLPHGLVARRMFGMEQLTCPPLCPSQVAINNEVLVVMSDRHYAHNGTILDLCIQSVS